MATSVVGEIHVSAPTSVAFDSHGYLFVSSNNKANPVVYKYSTQPSKLLGEIGKGVLKEPADILVDGNALYVSDFGAGQVVKISLDNILKFEVFAKLENPNGIRLGPDGNIYISQTYKVGGLFGKGRVNVYSKKGEQLGSFHADAAFGLAFNKTGKLLVADWRSFFGNGIMEYTRAISTPEWHLEGRFGGSDATAPFGICTDSDDNTYICTFLGSVIKYNSKWEVLKHVHGEGWHLSDVEVGPDGLVYVADGFKNVVLKYKF